MPPHTDDLRIRNFEPQLTPAELKKLAPLVSSYLALQRALAVDDLAKSQDAAKEIQLHAVVERVTGQKTSCSDRSSSCGVVQTSVLELAEKVGRVMGVKPEIVHAPARAGELFRSSLDVGKDALKNGGFGAPRTEGLPAADWVLIDADDVIVHIFRPEVRSFYNLERMWAFEERKPATAAR